MNTEIQFILKEQNSITQEISLSWVKETHLKISDLVSGEEPMIINITHSKINTIIDFTKTKNYQVLFFDNENRFLGASYAIRSAYGNFLLQTQLKWIMLIPLEHAFKREPLNKIEKLVFNYQLNSEDKERWMTCLKEQFPLAIHTSIGRLSTTVRRMKAEKELNIPLQWRKGVAISVNSGKRGNEMKASEWNTFYEELSADLKQKYS